MTPINFGVKPLGFTGRQTSSLATYAEILRDTYSASEVWPLVDIASGTDLTAFINAARTGLVQGWDFQNAAGPVTGTLAPYSDGANDYGNIYTSNGSTGVNDIFDPDKGCVSMWLKKPSWLGIKYAFIMREDVRNSIYFAHNTTTFIFATEFNDVAKTITKTLSHNNWFNVGMSWDTSLDEFKAYYNGQQEGATQSSLGSWSNPNLDSTRTNIGALTTVPERTFDGNLAYTAVLFGDTWSPAQFEGIYNAASTAGPD